ncbi:macrolide ABC transporter ATP-binding protein [Candidatus Roizmanbacteria bacterium CG_4_9_14_0_2_um_filter_38_17]|nr:ABC transporter ATP-binding protein [Candidatus Microgenomates bacterium]PJC30562.1 MAG: macrolide ABC transporter ATP-binding protein [Candidatus Roizmanbacteria bacterium CG_4_9_14_0_2_um_filter_38_17]
MKPLLTLKDVSRTYELGGVAVHALNKVSTELKEGEFVAIMGPSGSGKSTLMHIIGLLDTPSSGELLYKDKSIKNLSENDRAKLRNKVIGFVFQQFNLIKKVSALDNVILPIIYRHERIKNSKKIGARLLTRLGLGNRQDHAPNQLSGGQQQRVAIARALINDPEIILADEPTGNLDTKTGDQIMQILKNLNNEGKTIVMVTHESEIAKYADRIIRIVDGKIIEDK